MDDTREIGVSDMYGGYKSIHSEMRTLLLDLPVSKFGTGLETSKDYRY